MRHDGPSSDLRVRERARELFGGSVAVEREREAFDIVGALPMGQRCSRGLEVQEALPSPELLVVDTVAPLHLPVLLGAPRLDAPMPDARLLHPEDKVQRELCAVIGLHLVRTCSRNARLLRWFCSRDSRNTRSRVQSSRAVY